MLYQCRRHLILKVTLSVTVASINGGVGRTISHGFEKWGRGGVKSRKSVGLAILGKTGGLSYIDLRILLDGVVREV